MIFKFTTLIPTNLLIQIKILLKIKESVPLRAHMLIMRVVILTPANSH